MQSGGKLFDDGHAAQQLELPHELSCLVSSASQADLPIILAEAAACSSPTAVRPCVTVISPARLINLNSQTAVGPTFTR